MKTDSKYRIDPRMCSRRRQRDAGTQLPTLTAPSVTQAAVPQPKKPEPQPEVEKVTETIEGERLNIYLAYLPIEPAKVIQGSGYETYLSMTAITICFSTI